MGQEFKLKKPFLPCMIINQACHLVVNSLELACLASNLSSMPKVDLLICARQLSDTRLAPRLLAVQYLH